MNPRFVSPRIRLFLLVAITLLSPRLFAQATASGNIQGTVVDQSQAVVANPDPDRAVPIAADQPADLRPILGSGVRRQRHSEAQAGAGHQLHVLESLAVQNGANHAGRQIG